MLSNDGDLVGKPDSVAAVRHRWRHMAGGTGELFTGHCLVRLRDGDVVHQTAESSRTTVIFGTPSAAELDAYIGSGEPFKVAGAFTLDGLGGGGSSKRSEGDPSGVIGIQFAAYLAIGLQDAVPSVADLWVRPNPPR